MQMTSAQKKIAAAVLLAAVFGVALWVGYATVTKDRDGGGTDLAPRRAPTTGEYRVEAKEVLAPFMTQALALGDDDLAALPPQFADLVAGTEERLIRLVVPADERPAHLEAVLLLEQWKRALPGTQGERIAAWQKTKEFAKRYSWVAP